MFAANPVGGVMYALIAVSLVAQSLCGGGDGDFDFDWGWRRRGLLAVDKIYLDADRFDLYGVIQVWSSAPGARSGEVDTGSP